MPQPPNPIRVLYVIGAARSGSTVLNTLLGSHPDIVAAGELGPGVSKSEHVFRQVCSCGAGATKCDFWSRVHAQWVNLGEPDSLEDYATLQRRFELGRFRPQESSRGSGRQSAAYVKYARLARHLLAAICDVSGKKIIVDTTKTPWRAMMLAGLPGVELRVLHLVRHPAGVAWSMKKALHAGTGRMTDQFRRPVAHTCLYWLIRNLQAGFVRRSLPSKNSLRVKYEDLVQAPVDVMRRIGQLLDCNLDRIGAQAAAGEAFRVDHTIAGNRLRMDGAVRLRMDSDWQNHLTPHDRFLCASLTGWLARIYGYENLLGTSRVTTRPVHS
jgi:Sulfotransferase family